jgi:hypothetical protein
VVLEKKFGGFVAMGMNGMQQLTAEQVALAVHIAQGRDLLMNAIFQLSIQNC